MDGLTVHLTDTTTPFSRKREIKHVVALMISLLLTSSSGYSADMETPQIDDVVAFMNTSVLPMDTERVLENQTVIIRDGFIAAIGPFSAIEIPEGAARINGQGKFLMPGLADMHVHVYAVSLLPSYLAYGVTTVLNLQGDPDYLELRENLRTGAVIGPNLYTSGPIVDGDPSVASGEVGKDLLLVSSPEDVKEVVSAQKRAGYDVIKIYNGFPQHAFPALMESARENDIPVVGHISRKVGAEATLAGGQDVIAHAEEYFFTYFDCVKCNLERRPDMGKIPEIVKFTKDAGTFVVPNLVFSYMLRLQLDDWQSVADHPESRYLSPGFRDFWRENNVSVRTNLDEGFDEREQVKYPFLKKLTKALADEGVPLLLGTDSTAVGMYPGYTAHIELEEMVSAGLSPFQALQTATKNAGDFLSLKSHLKEKFGLVAVDHRADLILLAANPLADVKNTSAVEGVMVRGRWWWKRDLTKIRDELAEKFLMPTEPRDLP